MTRCQKNSVYSETVYLNEGNLALILIKILWGHNDFLSVSKFRFYTLAFNRVCVEMLFMCYNNCVIIHQFLIILDIPEKTLLSLNFNVKNFEFDQHSTRS